MSYFNLKPTVITDCHSREESREDSLAVHLERQGRQSQEDIAEELPSVEGRLEGEIPQAEAQIRGQSQQARRIQQVMEAAELEVQTEAEGGGLMVAEVDFVVEEYSESLQAVQTQAEHPFPQEAHDCRHSALEV